MEIKKEISVTLTEEEAIILWKLINKKKLTEKETWVASEMSGSIHRAL